MSVYLLPDNREISEGTPFELNGYKFPATWLERASPEMLDAYGIVKLPDPEPEPPSLQELQRKLDLDAWSECVSRLEMATVSVTTSAGTHDYSLGAEHRENIIGINLEIQAEKAGTLPGGTVPNPRPWFPAGAATPVMLTWDDLALLGSKMRETKEAYLSAYFSHRAAIYAATKVDDIIDYDVTTNWPS